MEATNAPAVQDSRSENVRRHYWLVAGIVGAAHLVLLILDTVYGAGFFRADRAQQRFHAMQAVLSAGNEPGALLNALVSNGNIGDYGLQAALYAAAGPLGVTLIQTLLAVPAVLCVVYIAQRATGSRHIALAAGLLYGLLPQSLAFPHQLLSEAVANPLLIFGTAALVRALSAGSRWQHWLQGGLLMGLAGLVRPALVLLPLVSATLLVLLQRRHLDYAKLCAFIVAGFLPCVLWGSFMLSQTGKFGFGESNQDLGINFSQSTAKVLLDAGVARADGGAPDWLPLRLSLGEYVGFVRRYPAGFANLYFKNAVVLLSDSGIGRLYVDLLGFGAEARLKLQDPLTGWRAQLTNHGPMAMLRQGLIDAPGTIIAGVLGAGAFAFVNVGLALAYWWLLLRRRSPLWRAEGPLTQRWIIAFLLVLPLYVLATSQVVAYAPSRLRSQGEFAWAVLACIGWAEVVALLRARRALRQSAASAPAT
ncbi:MAG: hypothetical protein ABI859_04350 [Pseudomonadota bacterium]